MPVYTVHAPTADGMNPRGMVENSVFVRDGFHFWAFLFGPFWLLYHRLWLALIGYLVIVLGTSVALSLLHVGSGRRFVVMLLIALLMGFEAPSLRRWTLSRRKWRQLDIVAANNLQAAERRFFDGWTVRQRDLANDQSAVDRGAPPPTRDMPGQPFSRPPASQHNDIVGLFPQPGASG